MLLPVAPDLKALLHLSDSVSADDLIALAAVVSFGVVMAAISFSEWASKKLGRFLK